MVIALDRRIRPGTVLFVKTGRHKGTVAAVSTRAAGAW